MVGRYNYIGKCVVDRPALHSKEGVVGQTTRSSLPRCPEMQHQYTVPTDKGPRSPPARSSPTQAVNGSCENDENILPEGTEVTGVVVGHTHGQKVNLMRPQQDEENQGSKSNRKAPLRSL